jgi:hypothetical protein
MLDPTIVANRVRNQNLFIGWSPQKHRWFAGVSSGPEKTGTRESQNKLLIPTKQNLPWGRTDIWKKAELPKDSTSWRRFGHFFVWFLDPSPFLSSSRNSPSNHLEDELLQTPPQATPGADLKFRSAALNAVFIIIKTYKIYSAEK